jgi:hypothetical protein
MIKVWLCFCSMRLGRSFYSPKGPRSRLIFIWKALVAFCPWVHRTVQCTPNTEQLMISFLPCRSRPLITWHTIQSDGAPNSLVQPSDRLLGWRGPRRLCDRALTRFAAGISDSLVNYSRDVSAIFRELSVRLAEQFGHRTLSDALHTDTSLVKLSQTSSLQYC